MHFVKIPFQYQFLYQKDLSIQEYAYETPEIQIYKKTPKIV